MNHGKITLIPDYISPVRRMKHDLRMADWRMKLKAGRSARQPVEITGRPTWRIQTKPHIGMQLKRIFPGIIGSPDEMYYAHSPDAARNIEWFLTRYPMSVSPANALYSAAKGHRDREKKVAELMRLGPAAISDLPQIELARPLWDNQKIGIELAHERRHLIIADAVGEGKTAQAIGLACKIRGFTVVVTLTALPRQWERAVADWTRDGLKVHVITEAQPYDLTKRKRSGKRKLPDTPAPMPDMVILSWSKLANWAEYLMPMVAGGLVVWDEGQELRTGDESLKWDGAYTLASVAGWVVTLSATPFYNYGGEFWNVAECTAPGELGTKEEFHKTWCVSRQGKMVIEDPVAFGTYLYESGLMIRRCRPKQETKKIVQWIDTANERLEADGEELEKLARKILKDGEESRGEKMRLSGQFDMWMRQVTGIDKAPGVADFVKLLVDSGEKVLLMGHHREVFSIWMKQLSQFHPVMYTGSETPKQKDEAMSQFAGAPSGSAPERYKGGQSDVMICANRAGAGLDGLQYVCRVIVIGEFDWSSGIMEQNIGRVDREGQTKTVLPYLMASDTPADHKLMEVNGVKRQQIVGVRDLKSEFIEKMQTDAGHVRALALAYLQSRGVKP